MNIIYSNDFYIRNNYYHFNSDNVIVLYNNLNIIIKEMEHLDDIKDEISSQQYLTKSTILLKCYNIINDAYR
jgi:hypothetical protein